MSEILRILLVNFFEARPLSRQAYCSWPRRHHLLIASELSQNITGQTESCVGPLTLLRFVRRHPFYPSFSVAGIGIEPISSAPKADVFPLDDPAKLTSLHLNHARLSKTNFASARCRRDSNPHLPRRQRGIPRN